MAVPHGIDIRQSGSGVLVRVGIDDGSGNALGTGTATLRVVEFQADGTIKQLDFADNTLKASGFTTPTTALSAVSTSDGLVCGLWTKALSAAQCANFSVGNIYVILVTHSVLSGVVIRREWQYGGTDGDQVVQTGDSFARIGGNGAGLTAVALTSGEHVNITADASTALNAAVPGTPAANSVYDRIDAKISSRLSGTSYAAPPTTSQIVGAILVNPSNRLATDSAGRVAVGSNADKSGYTLGSAGLDPITIETGINMRQATAGILASAAGVVSGAATNTVTIFGGGVSIPRIVATVDPDGNRSAVTLSLPA